MGRSGRSKHDQTQIAPPTTMLLTGPLSPTPLQPPSLPAAGGNSDDNELCPPTDPLVHDPPPPYPSPRHQRTPRTGTLPRSARRVQYSPRLVYHQPHSSSDSQDRGNSSTSPGIQSDEDFVVEPTEHTQLLGPSIVRRVVSGGSRQRSYSHTSTLSAAPSLARTVFSLFQAEEDLPQDPYASDDDHEVRTYLVTQDHHQDGVGDTRRSRSPSSKGGFFSVAGWKRYFRPLTKKVYYKTLLHLMVINFPYALVAWLYLFVFTVAGTTLLMALPLGAFLCFFNLLGARTFSRGELAIQYYFHKPLSYPPPSPPRPIFTRYRERDPTAAELEQGVMMRPRTLVRETSFYKNTYAMFTDPTSYQALFYFLVIKPAITLMLLISLWIFVPLFFALILPAPAILRAARKLGIWQANVAVEGLYLAVR